MPPYWSIVPFVKKEAALIPASAWRQIELEVPTRKYRFPKVHEVPLRIEDRNFRQLFVKDLGHEEPTILLESSTPPSTCLGGTACRSACAPDPSGAGRGLKPAVPIRKSGTRPERCHS